MRRTRRPDSKEVQFSVIRETLGVSDAVCSKHVKVLADKGYVLVSKRQGGRTAHDVTWVELTDEGAEAFESHLAALCQIANGIMPSAD